ncbi:6-bladed beta-propeller [Roseivirga sp.]|uniref:6-bladed beta-propeller n=1 Tax=Roseivirga sp. TaxID=1964215 RepID=UPI002B277C7D|nr:6-bladed beta-propeller [Roseivirga sp.]
MKPLFYSFLIFLFLSACTSNPSTTETQTDGGIEIIDVANAERYDGTLDALIEDIYFVQLEASEEALFSEASKVLFAKDEILVLDKRNNKVLAFDEEGNFLFKIFQKGNGPGEYKEIFSMAYVGDNNQIILAAPGKFLWFDMQGDFIREVKSTLPPIYISDMAYVGNSQFAIYPDLHGGVSDDATAMRSFILDSQANVIASYQPFNKAVRTENSTGMYSHFSASKTPLAVGVYSHNVWKFESGEAEIAYRFDFGVDAMPEDFIDTYITDPSLTSQRVREIIAEKDYWAIYGGALQETDQSIFFLCSNRKEYQPALYDMQTKKVMTFSSAIKNDRGDKGYLSFFASHDGYFVTSYNSQLLSGLLDMDKLTAQQKKMVESIGKEEIPLLWFVKFKKVNEIEMD